MPSHSPVTVRAVNTFVEELAFGENDVSLFYEDNPVRLQLKHAEYGVEAVMKDTQESEDQKEFQLQLAQECFDNGITYWSNSEHEPAMIEFQRALEIREEISGRLNEGTAKCYLWVGSIFWHKDEYEKALDNFSRSFRIRLTLSGSKEYCGIVTTWINRVLDVQGTTLDKNLYWKKFMSCIEHERRGDKLVEEGMYDYAIEEYRTALQFELRRRGLSANTPGRPLADAADLYSKIAHTYVEQENFARAMMEFRQALSIYLAKFGRHQRYSVETYDNMAYVGHLMGFREKFVNGYLESMYQSILHEKIADMLLDRKENQEALDEYMQALRLEEAGIGKLQVQCAMIYLKVAKACTRLGNQRSSLIFCCKALGIFDSALGSGHRNTITAMKIIKTITSGAKFQE